jgi:predicted dehydrogenase
MIADWKQSGKYGALTYLRVSMPPGEWTQSIEPAINCGDPITEVIQSEPVPSWMDKSTGDRYISFVNYYIHQVNLIRYLLGEDYTVKYADPTGKIMACESQSGVPIVLEMEPYSLHREWEEKYTACFNRGYIQLSLPAPMARQQAGKLTVYQNEGDNSAYLQPVIPPNWSMMEQARIFVDTVQGKRGNISPVSDAVKDLELAEAYIKLLVKIA